MSRSRSVNLLGSRFLKRPKSSPTVVINIRGRWIIAVAQFESFHHICTKLNVRPLLKASVCITENCAPVIDHNYVIAHPDLQFYIDAPTIIETSVIIIDLIGANIILQFANS